MRWAILTDKLPTTITVGKVSFELDVRTSTALNCIRKLKEDIAYEIKVMYITSRLGLATDFFDEAIEFLTGPSQAKGKGSPSFDYFQDANLIYSAFQQAYGLSLDEVTNMHWWRFLALLEGLPAGTRFMDVISIRTMEIDPKESPEVKLRKLKAKNSVALKSSKMEW